MIKNILFFSIVALTQFTYAKISTATYLYNSERPLVISHRGSSGHFPEESLGAFTDAYLAGADFIELDL